RVLCSVSLLYVGAMVLTHHAGARVVRETLSGGVDDPTEAVMVSPQPARPLRSDVLVAIAGGYLRGTQDWTATPPVSLSLEEGTAAVAAAGDVTSSEASMAITSARIDPDVAR